ncbi:MAG: FlgD immunoglobulin-like domain containing protein, partial [Balneolaceae bacterium]
MSEEIGIGSEPAGIHFRLQQLASEVEISIRDVNGTLIRTETLENIGQGDHQWIWDGKTDRGQQVPEGAYSIQLSARNGDEQVESLTFIEGTVDRIRFTGDGVQLEVNGVLLPLSDVEEIGS